MVDFFHGDLNVLAGMSADLLSVLSQTNLQFAFLQAKASQGKYINVSGGTSLVGTVCSYIPAVGNTFVQVTAEMSDDGQPIGPWLEQLKNGASVRETKVFSGSSGQIPYVCITTGDILVGDGVTSYQIYTNNTGGSNFYGTITGYLL